MTAPAPAAMSTARMVASIVACARLRCRDYLAQQRYVLQFVQKASAGIAACRLPTLNDRAGGIIELAGDLGIESKTGQSALNIATLALVKANLVFGELRGFVGKSRGIDACGQIAGRRAWTIL